MLDQSAQANTLSFYPLNSKGQPLANGVYLYIVTVRGYDGQIINTEVRKLVILR